MGQWNQTIYDKSYSSKLPMQAIRNLAGFSGADGMYFNTRTQVMPSVELCKQTAIGKFAFDQLFELEEEGLGSKHPTACGVLRWFTDLSIVFLQDMAAMMVLHPEREEAAINCLPVLQTEDFKVSFPNLKCHKDTKYLSLPKDSNPKAAWALPQYPGTVS